MFREVRLCAVFFILVVVTVTAAQSTNPSETLEAMVGPMAKIGRAFSPSFSPDGSQVAFVSDLNGLPQVWTVASAGGWPRLVTALDDQVGIVEWSPKADRLAVTVAPGGGMNVQVYLIRSNGMDLRRITDGGKETNALSGWTWDGGRLLLDSNRRTPATRDAYLYDWASGQVRLIADTGGTGGLTDVTRDGTRAILLRLKSRGDNNLYLLDLRQGGERPLTAHDGLALFGGGRFSPDGRAIYFTSNKDRDLIGLARVRLDDGGRPGPIELIGERSDAELQGFVLTEDGTTAALLWNVAGRTLRKRIEAALAKQRGA